MIVAGVLRDARPCGWCRSPLEVTQLKWCSKRCRQTAWRMRRISVAEDLGDTPEALRDVLPLCPPEARVGAWTKPNGADPRTRGPHNLWEPVIYMPARLRRPGVRNWLSAKPARGGGTLMGRKPLAFCAWLFQLLGASPTDQLDDLFPGTGIVSRAWGQFRASARAVGDTSASEPDDVSPDPRGDGLSRAAADDAGLSPPGTRDGVAS